MKNGCWKCAELPDDKLCARCELDALRATAEAAVHDYIDKSNQVIKQLQSKYDRKIDELSRKL